VKVLLQARIRSSDLRKGSRFLGRRKYDFRKVVDLKGERDATRKGRPEGVISSNPLQSTSRAEAANTGINVVCMLFAEI
jgi:hypothetical protein